MEDFEQAPPLHSVRWHMMVEGNNCSLLKNNVRNVIIRWNKTMDYRYFQLRSAILSEDEEKAPKYEPKEDELDEENPMSQLVI